MIVRLLKLGEGKQLVELADGATVGEALAEANVSSDGFAINVNGIDADLETELSDSDIIAMSPTGMKNQ